MDRIVKMSAHLADLIAAGEVVERPASVVKELCENAVDAGARTVTVELSRGGMEEIAVTDDGCGMSPADARTAFLRHATSKLQREEQLSSIMTLGFRGEALAAIAAVSKVELTTCERDAEAGTFLLLEGGEEKAFEEIGCPAGTCIRVRELFYNTPARLKFIKKDASEGSLACATAEKCALAHPEVSFRLLKDGAEVFRTPGDGDLYSCIYCIYGAEVAKSLIAVEYKYESALVKGYLSRPEKSRGNRTMQHFFLNGRPVKNKILSVAVEEGCRGSVMVGKFPVCFLTVTVEPESVDVNVHPTKSEVKFSAEKDVFDALYFGAKNAVAEQKAPVPETVKPALFSEETGAQQALTEAQAPAEPEPAEEKAPPVILPNTVIFTKEEEKQPEKEPEVYIPYRPKPEPSYLAQSRVTLTRAENTPSPVFSAEPIEPIIPENNRKAPIPAPAIPTEKSQSALTYAVGEYRIIGEFARLYVLVECNEELVVVDKHAVHERILYERLKENPADEASQTFLKPVVVNLTGEDMASFEENAPLLSAAGFECEPFGAQSIAVRSVPLNLSREDVAPLIGEMLSLAGNRRDGAAERRDKVLHTVACRAAIKAGMKNALPELDILVRRALFDPAIRYCPHGRPVKWSLDKKELEKRFGRSGNLS